MLRAARSGDRTAVCPRRRRRPPRPTAAQAGADQGNHDCPQMLVLRVLMVLRVRC